MTTKPFLLAIALLAACGDNHELLDAGDGPHDAAPDRERAVVVAGDYTPGNPGTLAVIDVATRLVLPMTPPAGAVAEDPILRYEAGELFIVNRGAGNSVTILDAKTLALVEQFGTGASSNPQDVAIVGDKLFVPTLGTKGAIVLTRGSNTVREIDLSMDDPDGKPNCSSVYKVGPRLFVACGLLDDTMRFLPPRGNGKVYVLDVATFNRVATITLTTKNPISLFQQLPPFAPNAGDLLLPTVEFATGMGCVERITANATVPNSAGCVVTNTVLGNFASRVGVYAVEFTGPVRSNIVVPPIMYMAVPDPIDYTKAALRGYDLSTGMLSADQSPATQTIGDLVVCPSGELVVADTRMGSSGLRIYRGTTEATTAPLELALRPVSSNGLACF